MKNNILNQKTDDFLSRKLDWSFIQQEMKSKFGQGIYESWIKNINLKKEFNHYVVLSAPTRFVRDWIASRYADKVLDIIKTFKETKNLL